MSISSISSGSMSSLGGLPPKKPDASEIISKDDQDGNGKLDSVEISDLAKHLSEMSGQEVDGESLIQDYDTDGDGELNADELKAAMEDVKPSGPPPSGGPGGAGASESDSEEEYDDLDVNKDGVVSYTERLAGQTDLTEVALAALSGVESDE